MSPVDRATAKPPPPPPPPAPKAEAAKAPAQADTAQVAAKQPTAVQKELKADGFVNKPAPVNQPAIQPAVQQAIESKQVAQTDLAAKTAQETQLIQEQQAAQQAAQDAAAAQQAAQAAQQAAATATQQAAEVSTDLTAATGGAADTAKQAAATAEAAAAQATVAAERAKESAAATGDPQAIAVAQQAEQAATSAQQAAEKATEAAEKVEKTQQAVEEIQNRGQGLDLAIVNQALQSTGDPKVKEDLVNLVADGTLTEKSQGAGNVLDILVDLAGGGQTATGANKQEVLKDLVSDLARPERMVQGQGNRDCGGAAAAYVLASENPAEYTRIVSDLATQGEAEIKTGATTDPLKLTVDQVSDGGNGRPVTQELIQSSFVQMADQKVSVDTAVGDFMEKGLFASELEKGATDLLGKDYDTMYIPDGKEALSSTVRDFAKDEASRVLQEQVGAGAKAMVNYDGHWVVVDEIKDGKATIFDSTGKPSEVSMNDLVDKADSVIYRSDVSTTDKMLGNQKWDDAGGGGKIGDGTNDGDDYAGYP